MGGCRLSGSRNSWILTYMGRRGMVGGRSGVAGLSFPCGFFFFLFSSLSYLAMRAPQAQERSGWTGDGQTRETSRWLKPGLCPAGPWRAVPHSTGQVMTGQSCRCSLMWTGGGGLIRGVERSLEMQSVALGSTRVPLLGCVTFSKCHISLSLFIYKMGKSSHKFEKISQAPPGSEIR